MKYAAIIPPPYTMRTLRNYGLGYHFALGQHLVNDETYLLTYQALGRFGHFIIVDNGAAEPESERVDFSSIVDAANEVHADEIILPDELECSDATIMMTTDKLVDESIPVMYRMIVPQGRSLEEWMWCLTQISDRIEFHSLGIAKHLEGKVKGGRATILHHLSTNFPWILRRHPIHLLGIYKNARQEILDAQKAFKWVRGIDSGIAAAYAQHDAEIEDEVPHYSLDWELPVNEHFLGLNVARLQSICLQGGF